MMAIVQRVMRASVSVRGRPISSIRRGVVIFLGVARGDIIADVDYLARKISEMRIFEDESGKMNKSVLDIGGEALVISQFTLLADCRRGRRPAFNSAAPSEEAKRLYESFVTNLASRDVTVATGQFGAMMEVSLVNDGPVTIQLESIKR